MRQCIKPYLVHSLSLISLYQINTHRYTNVFLGHQFISTIVHCKIFHPWRWPFEGWNMLEWHTEFIKWWPINTWVHQSVFMWYQTGQDSTICDIRQDRTVRYVISDRTGQYDMWYQTGQDSTLCDIRQDRYAWLKQSCRVITALHVQLVVLYSSVLPCSIYSTFPAISST